MNYYVYNKWTFRTDRFTAQELRNVFDSWWFHTCLPHLIPGAVWQNSWCEVWAEQ